MASYIKLRLWQSATTELMIDRDSGDASTQTFKALISFPRTPFDGRALTYSKGIMAGCPIVNT